MKSQGICKEFSHTLFWLHAQLHILTYTLEDRHWFDSSAKKKSTK